MTANRWDAEIEAFAARDRSAPPPPDPLVFTGSSTIRLWAGLEQRWPGGRVLNRGFGGARAVDCLHFVEQTAIRYRPRQVVLYAGGNDLARGTAPDEVAALLQATMQAVLDATAADVVSLSVLPHRAFGAFLEQTLRLNRSLRAFADQHEGVAFVDACQAMLALQTPAPRSFFVDDDIHLSRAGYAFLEACLEPSLAR